MIYSVMFLYYIGGISVLILCSIVVGVLIICDSLYILEKMVEVLVNFNFWLIWYFAVLIIYNVIVWYLFSNLEIFFDYKGLWFGYNFCMIWFGVDIFKELDCYILEVIYGCEVIFIYSMFE